MDNKYFRKKTAFPLLIHFTLSFPMIIGHEAIRDRLKRAVKSGRVAHAFLFVGPESVGKRAVALELSSLLLGDLLASDVTTIRPERVEEKGRVREKMIGVETIRDAIRALGLSHRAKGGKVLIVDDAHRLSEGAQNAFLKTLEEPFPGTTIFLVTHEGGAILPTLASRMERISFSRVFPAELLEYFPDVPESIRNLGRPGLAISYREHPSEFDVLVRQLEQLFSFEKLSFHDRMNLADAFFEDVSQAEKLFSCWMSAVDARVFSLKDTIQRREQLRLLHAIAATLRDLRQFPGSVRMTIEQFFLFRRSRASVYSIDNMSS